MKDCFLFKQLIQATARVLEKVVADPHHTSEINKEDFGNKGGGVRVNIWILIILLCALYLNVFQISGWEHVVHVE